MSSSGLFIVSLCNSAAGCHGESALRLSFRHEFGKKPCERAGKLCEFAKLLFLGGSLTQICFCLKTNFFFCLFFL